MIIIMMEASHIIIEMRHEDSSEDAFIQVSEVAEVCDQVPESVLQDVRQLSPPPPPPRKQQCQKHSRCHCDLLSLGTSNFYTVSP